MSAEAHAPGAGPAPPPDVSPARLLAVLGVGGAVAGVLLVVAFGLTLPRIEANRARALDIAIKEVLKAPARYDTLFVVDGALTPTPPAGADPKQLEKIYLGYGDDGRAIGFAILAADAGFQDVITLIFGYDARSRQLLGMKVLESKETPGLGDKIEKSEAFIAQFAGAEPPLTGVKGKRAKPSEVTMITGATISSRAVIRIIDRAVARLGPLLDAYRKEG